MAAFTPLIGNQFSSISIRAFGSGTLTVQAPLEASSISLEADEIDLLGGAGSVRTNSISLNLGTSNQNILVGGNADSGSGTLDITSDDLNTIDLQGNFPKISIGSNLFVNSGDITVVNGSTPLKFDGSLSLNTTTGTIAVERILDVDGNISFDANEIKVDQILDINGYISFTANEIDLLGGVDSIRTTNGQSISLRPQTFSTDITLGGTAETGTATLDLTVNDLSALKDGFSSINISTSKNITAVNGTTPLTFDDSLSLNASTISVERALDVDGDISFSAREIDLLGGVNSISTTNGGSIEIQAGRDIALGGTSDSGTEILDLTENDLSTLKDGFSSIRILTDGKVSVLNNADPLTFNDSLEINTDASITVERLLNVNGNLILTSTDRNEGSITVDREINVAGNIEVNNRGTTNFNSNVQAASLTTNTRGKTQINGNVTTTNSQTYNNILTLANDTTLTGNKLNFAGNVSGSGHNLILQPSTSSQNIQIGSLTDISDTNTLDITDAELKRLQNGFNSITIGRADGTGTITIDSNGVNFNDPLNLRSPNSGGAIVANGQIQTNGNPLTLSAGNTVDVNANVTTAGADININSSGIIDTTGGTLNSSSSGNGGAINLTATNGNITTGNINSSASSSGTGGNINITSSSGAIDTSAGSLDASSTSGTGGQIQLNANTSITPGNIKTTNNNFNLDAPVNLTNDTSIEIGGTGGNVNFNNTVNGNQNLTVNSGAGDINFNSQVGNTQPLGNIQVGSTGTTRFNSSVQATSITTDAGGETQINSNITTTGTNGQNYNDNLRIDNNTTLNSNNNPININGTINSQPGETNNLTANAGTSNITITGQVGNTQPLGNIQLNSTGTTRTNSSVQATSITTDSGGETQINGNITTTGTNGQNYNDNLRIDNNATLNSNNNPITVNGTINSQTGETNNLTANAGTSNITIAGEVGNTQPLGNLQLNSTGTNRLNSTVQAASITTDSGGETQINSNITTTGTNGQNYNDNVRIDNNTTLNSNNNPININGTINSQPGETNNLNINSGNSNTTLNGDAGNTNPLGDININSTNNITTPNLTANNINLTSGNNITTGNLNTNSTTGNSGNVNLTATGNINTNNINTNSTSGNGGAVNITATGNTNTANINTNSSSGNGGEIAIQGTNVTTGNLNSSGNSGGNTSIQATTSIKAGEINSSGTSGNGGNVTLDPENDIEVNSINAQGGANGVGGNVDITTQQNFRATDTFTDQNGTNASISTAGGQGGGSVTIRHGGGSQNTPFVVGDATTNGTAGAITTGTNNTIAPVQSFPGSYSQGTSPSEIQIITQDSASSEFDKPEDLEKIPDLPSQTEPQQSVETVVSKIEEHFTTQADEYLGGKTRIKTLDEIRNELRGIVAATDSKVKPGIIYTFFLPRGPVVRPEIDGDKTPPKSDIALEVPLELMLVTSEGKVITKSNFEVTRTQVLTEANKFLASVSSRSKEGTTEYQKPAKQFYDWLIKPIEKDLEAQGVNNLVFVMDEGLRSLPLAAMQDPQDHKFIIQKGYSIGLTPSMSLINIREADIRNALKNTRVLAMGASKFTELKPLPGVETEISLILKQWSGDSFLNDKFTIENLRAAHNNGSYQILHLATHAKFVPSPLSNSYIQFGEGEKVNLDDILKLGLKEPLVELLVLSACETAWGNKDAELGFAGIARLSGAKSVLASLWEINDVTNLGLMTEFYTKLKTAPTKAEALRQAQVAMLEGKVKFENGALVGDEYREPLPTELNIEDKVLSHPHYWSGFTMIGNPW